MYDDDSTPAISEPQALTPEETTFPPRLREYYRRGFNCRTGDFISRDVFRFGESTETHDYYGTEVEVPTELIFTLNSDGRSSEGSEIYKAKTEYDEKLTLEFGLEWGALDFEGSAESTLTTTRHVSFEHDRTSTVMERRQNVYECYRPEDVVAEHLEQDYVAALAELPPRLPPDADCDTPEYKAYERFFERFGTHYLVGGTIGAKLVFVSQIQRTLVNSSSETTVSAAISGGYEGMIAKGKFNAKVAIESSRFLEENRESFHHETYNMGGLMRDPEGDIADWIATVKDQPILLADSLSSSPKRGLAVQARLIEVALPDDPNRAEREESMNRALGIYAPLGRRSLFATPFDKQVNRVHRLAGDGLVVLTGHGPESEARGEIGLAGSLPARAFTTTHKWANLPMANLMMPGRAGQEITTSASPERGSTLQVFELRSGSMFGEIPTERRLTSRETVKFKAAEDGLLLCAVRNSSTLERQTFRVTIGDWPMFQMTPMREREALFPIPEVHATIPVRQGTECELYYWADSSDDNVNAGYAWVPLSPTLRFGEPIEVQAGIAREAETDGLLFGWMFDDDSAQKDKYGHYAVRVAVPAEHIPWDSVRGLPGASMIYPVMSDGSSLYIEGSTATHVVRMGYVYRVMQEKQPDVYSRYIWTPLLAV